MEYVINAIDAYRKLRQRELHEYERPIALMILHNAEGNRDRKKVRKPYSLDQFCFYGDKEDGNTPAARYGAAAMALIEKGLFPAWALFVYQDLKKNASGAPPPGLLCYYCDDAIVLAPDVSESGCRGLLIARRAASGKVLSMRSEGGDEVRLGMPQITSNVYADEEAVMDVYYIKQSVLRAIPQTI